MQLGKRVLSLRYLHCLSHFNCFSAALSRGKVWLPLWLFKCDLQALHERDRALGELETATKMMEEYRCWA